MRPAELTLMFWQITRANQIHRGYQMKRVMWVSSALLLSGCSSVITELNDPERFEQVEGVDKHSSYPAVRRDSFEKVNLLEMIDPENQAAVTFKTNWERAKGSPDDTRQHKAIDIGAKYDLALALFRQRTDITSEEKKRRRNSIQERILSVSISRCNVFKTFLRRDQADKNFLLGTATTVSAVFGALVPAADAARSWSGVAGLFSGVRSEYNQAYYSSLAAHVIVKGIETRQEQVYRRIQTEGQSKTIEVYPLEAAIKDAIYFDGLCSVVAGLDQAAASIDATAEPGIDAAMRTLLRARLLKESADLSREQLLKPETLESLGRAGSRLGMSLVGSMLDEPAKDPDLYSAAGRMIEHVKEAVDAAALRVEGEFLKRKTTLSTLLKPPVAQDVLDQQSPKAGEVMAWVRATLMDNVVAPLKLDACYVKLAAPADEKRVNAAKELASAKDDSDKVAANLKLEIAGKENALAGSKLTLKEKGVLLEIGKYETVLIKNIQAVVVTGDLKKTLGDLVAASKAKPEPATVGKEPSCTP